MAITTSAQREIWELSWWQCYQ